MDLFGDVFPATSFKKDGASEKKDEKVTANIHLVRNKAIRLFTERDSDGDWIRKIDLRPSILLYGTDDHPLTENDLTAALSMLKDKVSPLLADSRDARHIVPGLVDDGSHVASWRAIQSEVLVPDVDFLCFHGVSHPDTGPAEGATKTRLQLGNKGDTCVILIEPAMWTSVGTEGAVEVQGVRVRLTLRGNALLRSFRAFGKTSLMGKVMRLVSFRASGVIRGISPTPWRSERPFVWSIPSTRE